MSRYNAYARFSPCRKYRYELGGDIGQPDQPLLDLARVVRLIVWIMLNPSVANEVDDDRTIWTIVGFSERWGFNRMCVGNTCAWCDMDPQAMLKAQRSGIDVVGPENDDALRSMAQRARESGGEVVAAWGIHADRSRVKEVVEIMGPMKCLGTNKDGSPVHPLYRKKDSILIPWNLAEGA
jgi:hypothetical protein